MAVTSTPASPSPRRCGSSRSRVRSSRAIISFSSRDSASRAAAATSATIAGCSAGTVALTSMQPMTRAESGSMIGAPAHDQRCRMCATCSAA